MTKSALQIERTKYIPKMPDVLKENVVMAEGAKTESVDDQKEIQKLFPNTYGMPVINFEQKSGTPGMDNPINVRKSFISTSYKQYYFNTLISPIKAKIS